MAKNAYGCKTCGLRTAWAEGDNLSPFKLSKTGCPNYVGLYCGTVRNPGLILILLSSLRLFGAGVIVRFDPLSRAIGPFPTDALTVPDTTQRTGLRVNIPLPDCASQPNWCQEWSLINQLDGFNLQPRVRVRFSGPVDPNTLRQGIYFVALGNLTNEEYGLYRTGDLIPVNQVIYDPATLSAFAKPDEILDQHRRYGLIVTDAIRDPSGDPVLADAAFAKCTVSSDYCSKISELTLAQAERFSPRRIVAASVFTTMYATGWLEEARRRLANTNLNVQRTGVKSLFNVSDLSSLVLRFQTRSGSQALRDVVLPVEALAGAGRIAFGSFRSPVYLNDQSTIPAGTTPEPPGRDAEIAFHAYLPSDPAPRAGYPVVIFGHALGDSSFGGPSAVAAVLNQAGLAVIAINAFGHGYGPGSRVALGDKNGNTTEVPTLGRGVDVDGGGIIDAFEGCVLPSLGVRDCLRQTVVDLMQLVRAIRSGMDLDGDGKTDLDASRIYYAGQSLGGLYGTILSATEPEIRASALNVAGGSLAEIQRLSVVFRFLTLLQFGQRRPSLLNLGLDYDENYVLRDRPAKVNDVAGAIDIQEWFEFIEWYSVSGDPVAYAPHLKSSTLPDVPIKSVLWQLAKGDWIVPNPTTSALIRGANMRDSARLYRHDLARAIVPQLAANPHAFLAELTPPPALAIARAGQAQIAGFLNSDGTFIPDANETLRGIFGQDLFETPEPLPEETNF